MFPHMSDATHAEAASLRLVPLAERHLEFTRAWRNHPDSSRWFGDCAEITAEGQVRWFATHRTKPDDHIFVLEVAGRPVGQFSVYNILAASAEVGRFLVDPALRGRGYFRAGFTRLSSYCKTELGLRELYLYVKPNNERAIASYAAVGFSRRGEFEAGLRMDLTL
jgi:RimJ/RimL family protein N-acetyltransferase